MNCLGCRNLHYTYQGKYQKVNALNGVTCEFEKGKFYAIIGHSGCGKSTLLSLLGGLEMATQGEVFVDDHILSKKDLLDHRKQTVSMIYQSFHLFPKLTILENVMYPMIVVNQIKKMDAIQEKAKKTLIELGIQEEHFHKFPTMLSGGQQQRVAIARALMANGKVILADEPTGNLDLGNSKKIIDIFKWLSANGYCIIVVTHDFDLAKQADVIYKMQDGKIIETIYQ